MTDGDILLAAVGATYGKSFLFNRNHGEACYAGYLVRFSPVKQAHPRFFSYWTQSRSYWYQVDREVIQATVQNFSASRYQELVAPFPPPETQRAIADFLDRETAKIDTLVEKKRRLLELLDEERTALVTRAVTRGLDPDAPMKDSGVEWIGEIPEHWQVRQARYLCARTRPIIYGIVLPGPDVPDGVPLIKGGDVDRGDLAPEKLNRTAYDIEINHVRSRVTPPDIVYSIRGSFGQATVVPESLAGANITQDVARLSPRDSVDEHWLAAAISSAPVRALAEAGALGATIKGINIRDLRRLPIPTPPSAEQLRIADLLRQEEATLDKTRLRISDAISLLTEYRTSVISAAVTGKIEVRPKVPA